jgi:ABC-type phosphate/phosphonate transport system substrate-binding protein
MSKALLSALIAAAFVASAPAGAAVPRELLFGPEVVPNVPSVSELATNVEKTAAKALKAQRKLALKTKKLDPDSIEKPAVVVSVAASQVKTSNAVPVIAQTKELTPTALQATTQPLAKPAQLAQVTATSKVVPATLPPVTNIKEKAALAGVVGASVLSISPSMKAPAAPIKAVAALVPSVTPVQTSAIMKSAVPVVASAITPKKPLLDMAPVSPAVATGAPVATVAKVEAVVPAFVGNVESAYDVHDRLARKLSQSTEIGFLPGISTAQDSYDNINNYYPLMNFMSEKTGVLLSPSFEPDQLAFRRRILERKYPIIHINTQLVDAAVKSDYVPLVMNDLKLRGLFIVKANSPFKKLEDIGSRTVTMVVKASTGPAALNALIKAGVYDTVSINNVRNGLLSQVVREFEAGQSEVMMINNEVAKTVLEKAKGSLRVIHEEPSDLSYSYWVRKGAYDEQMITKLRESLISVNKQAGLDAVRLGIIRATNLKINYVPMTMDNAKSTIGSLTAINTKWTKFKSIDPEVLADLVAKNAESSAYSKISLSKNALLNNPFDEYARIAKTLPQKTRLGILPGLLLTQNVYSNISNYGPLLNYVSEKTGVLVVPTFEENVATFRKDILERKYPMIHINTQLVDAAVKSDYVPLVMNDLKLKAVFVVKENSPITKLSELKEKSISMSIKASTGPAALSALISAGIQDEVNVVDIKSGQLSLVIGEVTSGHTDAAMINSVAAKKLIDQGNSGLRVIDSAPADLSYSFWVRKGAYEEATLEKMRNALTSVTTQTNLATVREAITRSTNLPVNYVPMTMDSAQSTISDLNAINTKWSKFKIVDKDVSPELITKNINSSAFEKNTYGK